VSKPRCASIGEDVDSRAWVTAQVIPRAEQ
jgi:hypothetical protein